METVLDSIHRQHTFDVEPVEIDRRRMLGCLAGGFGSVGLAAMLGEAAAALAAPDQARIGHHLQRERRADHAGDAGGHLQQDEEEAVHDGFPA